VADCVEAYAQKPWFLQFMDKTFSSGYESVFQLARDLFGNSLNHFHFSADSFILLTQTRQTKSTTIST